MNVHVMSTVAVLTLRSPDNTARDMQAGYMTLAIQAMQRFPSSGQTQKQACLMIQILVRNSENRYGVGPTPLSPPSDIMITELIWLNND
jgi:hypothetical protein